MIHLHSNISQWRGELTMLFFDSLQALTQSIAMGTVVAVPECAEAFSHGLMVPLLQVEHLGYIFKALIKFRDANVPGNKPATSLGCVCDIQISYHHPSLYENTTEVAYGY